jgi:hypothetical protein
MKRKVVDLTAVKKKYKLQVFLYVAKDLPPADETGTSDPYVIVRCGGVSA